MREAFRWECAAPARRPDAPLRLACVFEQAIGHITFQANLARQMERWSDIAPAWHLLPFAAEGQRWPSRRLNWTLRAGLLARNALKGAIYDALLFHTHLPALLCPDHLRRAPALISMDATPAQNARLGVYAGAAQRHGLSRRLATGWTARSLQHAHRIVAWTQWVRQSLIEEYGISPERVAVLPPGVDVDLWSEGVEMPTVPGRTRWGGDLPRILFVGGDLWAKGGQTLLQCYRRHWRGRAELHLVTRSPLPQEPGVYLHRGMTPNSPALMALFRASDLFVLPTLGDTFAQVLLEAMATRLPVVASAVGGIPEVVEHGETGFLVPPRDGDEFFAAVEALIQDPHLRCRMGNAGYERARQGFDMPTNARRMVALLEEAGQSGGS